MKTGIALAVSAAFAAVLPTGAQGQTWEPTKNVEFIIPAGTGGGA
ncbi:MAG: tripartite tricarboxylate transporter substrate binding protein, partial [Betaproteobacteria bacterium]|nr:tripartite tricarboxylate transporter substrate binding protein [Betaproteobacteria bacterium]